MCVLQKNMNVRVTLVIRALKNNLDACLCWSMEARVVLVEHEGF